MSAKTSNLFAAVVALSSFGVAQAQAPAQPAAPPTEAGSASGQTTQGGCRPGEGVINPDCQRRADPKAGKTPKEAAPVDLSGDWVSMVVEDWRWRMVTPPKGDFASLPLNDEAKKVANTWDPKKDANNCKEWGAAGMIRNPMRIRMSWENDQTLKMETDHGQVTRVFNFQRSAVKDGEPSMQGQSVAEWDGPGLKVVTTKMLPGYLRKNGVPYSADAVMTEFYNRYQAFGEDWLSVTTVVYDPKYLTRELILSTDFKKLKDTSQWRPTPCGAGATATTMTR